MDDLIEAPPATVLDSPSLRQRPNQFVQGVMSFCAVVGIGAAVTLAVDPPLRVHVVTVERRIPQVAAPITPPAPVVPERKLEQSGRTVKSPRWKDPRTKLAQAAKPSHPMLTSKDCENDVLCGLDERKQ